MKKFVGTLRNTNAKLAIRKARGFRTYEIMETALYHQLGRLPELTTHSVEEAKKIPGQDFS